MTALITGDKEIMREFEALPAKLQKKLQKGVLKENAKVVLADARQNLRDQQEGGTGALSKSLKVRAVARSRVKFGWGVKLRDLDIGKFYGLFLEYGLTKTSPPRRHRSGKSTGDLPAQPFLRPALFNNRQRFKRKNIQALKRWLKTLKPVT